MKKTKTKQKHNNKKQNKTTSQMKPPTHKQKNLHQKKKMIRETNSSMYSNNVRIFCEDQNHGKVFIPPIYLAHLSYAQDEL